MHRHINDRSVTVIISHENVRMACAQYQITTLYTSHLAFTDRIISASILFCLNKFNVRANKNGYANMEGGVGCEGPAK